MKAVVMAGGEGSRLRPLTIDRPKPLLPVVNRPLLGHILTLLQRHDITDVVMTLQYLPAQIQDTFGDGKSLGMNIEYVIEEIPLGTAGSVKGAEALLPDSEPFLVISGDALTDFDLTALLNYHLDRHAKLTIALYRVPDPLEYGVISVDADGRISQFLEKPSWREVISDTVNTGIYVVQPEVLARIPANRPTDWSQDIFPAMLAQVEPLYGFVAGGYWCDIGTLAEYRRANADLLAGKLNLGELGDHIGGGIWTGGSVSIAPDAQLFGPIYLGKEVQIKSGVIVNGPVVIRDYSVLDNRARVDRSIIWRNCYIGERTELHGAVVCRQCSLKTGALLFEGTVIGDRSIIGEGASVQPEVKIWPGKEVDAGATVTHSIIWGSQGRRVLFGRFGVTGVVNVDLTPDMAARLGAAFGSVMPKGSIVTINRDPHRSPRMIKRAIISGLPSAGNHVVDLRTVPIPVARYYTRAVQAAGGVHVRLSPYDQRVVDIRFFGPDGLNLTREQERTVERVFFREDYRRVYLEEIGTIEVVPDASAVYTAGYMQAVDAEAIRHAGFKIVVDYAYATPVEVLPQLLEQLNVEVVPLNARIDANKISVAQDEFRAGLSQLARITGALHGISLGVRLDVGGEKIFVVDDTGSNIPDSTLAVAMAELVFRSHPGSTIVVSADQTSAFEKIAELHGGVVRRSAVDPQAMMRAATNDDVVMACDGTGNFAFPSFHPAVDGLLATGKLLELLAVQSVRLSDVVAGLPPFFVASGRVDGDPENKGKVMRSLMEQFSKFQHEVVDGIKIYLDEGEWVLIRPDEDAAVFHLVAEGHSKQAAQELIADYGGFVQSLIRESSTPAGVAAQHEAGIRPGGQAGT